VPTDSRHTPGNEPIGGDIPQPKLAHRILYAVLFGYFVVGGINILLDTPHQGMRVWWSMLCMLAVDALALLNISESAPRWPLWRKSASLGVQVFFTYFPFFALHELWGGMAGFVAGSALLLIRRPQAWALFTAVVASMYVFAAVTYHQAYWIAYYTIATMLLGLVLFGITRLSQLVDQMHAMRTEMARMAVVQERLRFARDLHDLLGYSLSSITLKSELAYRLVPGQPERARQELTEILDTSRQALADVREVASSYRDMSLEAEAASAQRMLETAQIDVSVRIETADLPADLATVLATTLREGVTNILRHSKVQRCSITAIRSGSLVRLEVANDGVTQRGEAETERSGSGLGNLRSRLAAFGGTLSAGVGPDRWFRLVAEVPEVPGAAAVTATTGTGGARDEQAHQAAAGRGRQDAASSAGGPA
jgi:two-component system sensor histidine kinase DesK